MVRKVGAYSFSTLLVHIESLAPDRELRKRGTTCQCLPWHTRVTVCVGRSLCTSLYGNLVCSRVLTTGSHHPKPVAQLCGGIMAPSFKFMDPPGPAHGPGRPQRTPSASPTTSDGTQVVFRGSPMPQNWENRVKIGQNRRKSPQERWRNS
jgi:hypothetical protein